MNDNEPETTKRCARCRQELPISQFAYDGRTMDRLKYRCETCIAEMGAYKR